MNKKLKKIMIDRDLTVTALAEKVGISRIWLSNILNGHQKAYKTRLKISELLGVPYEKLWRDGDKAAA